ncbi:MAG: hypothetical protein ACYC64_14510 [Armatimonadota bacterium]
MKTNCIDWTSALWIVLVGSLFLFAPPVCAIGSRRALAVLAELRTVSCCVYVVVLAAWVVSAALRVVRGRKNEA